MFQPFKQLATLLTSDKENNHMETSVQETTKTEPTTENKRVEGRITKIDGTGWGFISSRAVPFTRIFFHWTALRQDTLHFSKLTKGMTVEFVPVETTERGWKAIQIKVIESKTTEADKIEDTATEDPS